ncbi:SecC motif-containing protein [Providencia rettgeri]|uniref:SecC motif-containing protein n=1 Tax=Providencia rettgeri TaxID=587 RepID=UPI00235FB841|nr:SecC motif-containing protein [Providencia rettgeri]
MNDSIFNYLTNWMDISSSDKTILNEVEVLLNESKLKKQNEESNSLFLIKLIIDSHMLYDDILNLLFNKSYYDAWCRLENLEINLMNIKENIHYLDCNYDYGLQFLKNMTTNWQLLYPYKVFGSTRELIHEIRCSICKEKRSFLDDCGHVKGKLYMGELCYDEVTNWELITIDVVSNPVRKLSVFFPENGDNNNYSLLEIVLSYIKSKNQIFSVNVYERFMKDHDGILSPNSACPCSRSMKLYEDCCLKKNAIYLKHIDIWFPSPLAVDPIFQ